MIPATSRGKAAWATAVFALVILVPALYGFATKFVEFLALYQHQDGAFTIVPILNYLLASLGFLLLFGWAVLHGMFRDIEKPKHTMLATQRWLDGERAEEEKSSPAGEADHGHVRVT